MESAETVLRLEGITEEFPGVTALDGVSLEFRRGEVHGLVGENGAGQVDADEDPERGLPGRRGPHLLDGAEAPSAPPRGPGGRDQHHLPGVQPDPRFTVTENVFLNREPSGSSATWTGAPRASARGPSWTEIGIELDVDRKAGELSVVQQQVVEIVKALSVTASVLIMDEPSAALTDKELRKLFEIIRTLTRRGDGDLHLPHARRGLRDRRPGHRAEGRKVMGTRPAGS